MVPMAEYGILRRRVEIPAAARAGRALFVLGLALALTACAEPPAWTSAWT
jgi:hypothetical protein